MRCATTLDNAPRVVIRSGSGQPHTRVNNQRSNILGAGNVETLTKISDDNILLIRGYMHQSNHPTRKILPSIRVRITRADGSLYPVLASDQPTGW